MEEHGSFSILIIFQPKLVCPLFRPSLGYFNSNFYVRASESGLNRLYKVKVNPKFDEGGPENQHLDHFQLHTSWPIFTFFQNVFRC